MHETVVTDPDSWADLCSRSFVALGVTSADPSFRARLAQVQLPGGVKVTRVGSNSSEVFRSRRLTHSDPAEDLLLAVHGAGRGLVRQDDREARLEQGVAALYDTAHPYTLHFNGAMNETVLQMPKELVDRTDTLTSRLTARPIAAGNRILTTLTHVLTDTMTDTPSDDAEPRAQLLVELLRALLVSTDGTSVTLSRDALRAEALVLLRREACHRDTTPTTVAARLGISLRLLQLILAEGGTSPAAEIGRARLAAAQALLGDGVRIADCAYLVGFEDAGTFTRTARRVWGITPAEMRAQLSVPRHGSRRDRR